ncbi:MAG: hypothetical protein LBI31_07190, partial [Zoogloeaceae bacterium]|nr:hypothetical protein [Zoogloeaceae bacterium]
HFAVRKAIAVRKTGNPAGHPRFAPRGAELRHQAAASQAKRTVPENSQDLSTLLKCSSKNDKIPPFSNFSEGLSHD